MDKYSHVRAVDVLYSQVCDFRRAQSDHESEYIRIAAFERLGFSGNEKFFFNTAANTRLSYRLRVPIVEKITDEGMLFNIAYKEDDDAAIEFFLRKQELN